VPPAFRPPVLKTLPLVERLAACESLGELIDELVLSAMPFVERAGSGERMILARWSHAQTTYGAIVALAHEEEPDGQTIAMLSRPLFEAMVDVYWIASNPVKAQDLAVKHFRLLRIVVAKRHNARLLPGDPSLPIHPADVADRASLSTFFGSEAQKHWTTLDLRSRIRAVDADVPQDVDGELNNRYYEDNQLANLLLHGSPMAINDRLEPSATGITVRLGPTEQHMASGMRQAYWSYYRVGSLLVSRLLPSRLDDLIAMYRAGGLRYRQSQWAPSRQLDAMVGALVRADERPRTATVLSSASVSQETARRRIGRRTAAFGAV
jgi:hypothetical protein